MNQSGLIERITSVSRDLERAGSAFLGGSYGRGEADTVSDVDVYVVVAGQDDIPHMLTELSNNLEKVQPILFSNVLPNARTINAITQEWLRFDFTVLTQQEIVFFAQNQLKPLFDRLGVFAKMRPAAEYSRNLSADGLLEIVNEFIRVLGLSMVVNGRDDVITAQTGTWPSVFARSKALAEQFFPRARSLANELGAKWPDEFQRVTLELLRAKLGLNIELHQ